MYGSITVSYDDQQHEIETNSIIIENRDHQLKEIESNMQDLETIFVEVANLVESQSIGIDSIESHINTTVANTSYGVVELQKAERYQKSYRFKLCMILLFFILIGLLGAIAFVIILIIVIKLNKN